MSFLYRIRKKIILRLQENPPLHIPPYFFFCLFLPSVRSRSNKPCFCLVLHTPHRIDFGSQKRVINLNIRVHRVLSKYLINSKFGKSESMFFFSTVVSFWFLPTVFCSSPISGWFCHGFKYDFHIFVRSTYASAWWYEVRFIKYIGGMRYFSYCSSYKHNDTTILYTR